MGFMAGFGSAFASSFEKENDRQFQHNEDDFRYQMQAALQRQQQVNELDRQNAKDVMAAKQIAVAIGKPDSWSAWYYPLHSGAAYETVYNQALSSNVETGPADNKGATDGSGAAAPDASLTSGAKSAVDTQMGQAGMTPPTTGGLFSTDPQNTSGGTTPDASAASNVPAPDASTPPPAPNEGSGAPTTSPQAAAPPQDVNSPLTPQGDIPTPSPRPDGEPTAQVANPPAAIAPVAPSAPVAPMAPQSNAAPVAPPVEATAPAPDQTRTAAVADPVPQQTIPPTPTPQAHPTANPTGIPMPNMGQGGSWAQHNPGSQKNAARVAQNLGGQDEYNRVMNSSLITGTPIPGLDGQQVTFSPRGYMRPEQVNSLNDALAYQVGVSQDPHATIQAKSKAAALVNFYQNEERTKAKMIAIANHTYVPPSRAAITDNTGQPIPGQFAYPQMDQAGTDIAEDQNGPLWFNPNTKQRVPMGNLHVFSPDMEKDLADSQKQMGPIQAGYNEDKNLTIGMIRTAANMQQVAQQYPAAMGRSGDIAQVINNAKREGFNLASLIHPGLDPEATPVKIDNNTLGGIESYEKKVYKQFSSVVDPIKKTALAASLLDAQSIRLAYMQAKSMNETNGSGGQRVSQAQFEGLYHAIRSGEQPEGLGISNADFIMEKYNSLKDKESQMAGPGSPNAAFQQRYNIASPLTYGSSIDQDIAKDPQVSKAFDFFQNLQGNNSLTGQPMDPNGNAGGIIGNAVTEGKKLLGGQPAPEVKGAQVLLPPDIASEHPNAKLIGQTPDGQKIYGTPDGKKYLSTHKE